MKISDYTFEPLAILDRICEVYGFSQKIQLANHFDISASSLSNRYTRGTISYDFAAVCALETGADLRWLLTGQGERYSEKSSLPEAAKIETFTLSEETLTKDSVLNISTKFFTKPLADGLGVKADGKLYFVDKNIPFADGTWLVDIEGAISIRELTRLPGKKLHVAGGKVPFECGFDEIRTLGRVVGIYSEVN